jgi:nucleoside-diphosphate-sugar epimerase
VEKWVGLDRNTIRRLNFRRLTLTPTPGKNVNKIMEKLFKRYRMLTQVDMVKTKKELKFEPEYDIREGVRKILKHLE